MLIATLSPSRAVLVAALPLFLTAAAVSDLRTRRIPNALTALMALTGVAVGVSGSGPASWQSGLIAGGISLMAGMLLHTARVIGGGDIKLFAASAIWLGPAATVSAALATAIVGGVLALFFLRGRRPAMPSGGTPSRWQLDDTSDAPRVPYGVAIAGGCLWAWCALQLAAQ
jgi:prepilin peptidase CpaA